MSVYDHEFMIVPVKDGGFLIRSLTCTAYRDGITAGPADTYAFTNMHDMLVFLAEQAQQHKELPTRDEVNKLK